jgi:hypothetical protein
MKKNIKKRWQGFCAAGVSVVVVLGMGQMTQGAPSYRATPQGLDTPAEMQSYDPNTLHITFGQRPQAAEPEAVFQSASAPDPAPVDFFGVMQGPAGETSGPETPASAPEPGEISAVPPHSAVPEPGTFALVALGILGFVMRCRQRKSVKKL